MLDAVESPGAWKHRWESDGFIWVDKFYFLEERGEKLVFRQRPKEDRIEEALRWETTDPSHPRHRVNNLPHPLPIHRDPPRQRSLHRSRERNKIRPRLLLPPIPLILQRPLPFTLGNPSIIPPRNTATHAHQISRLQRRNPWRVQLGVSASRDPTRCPEREGGGLRGRPVGREIGFP